MPDSDFAIHTERVGDEVIMTITGAPVIGVEYDQDGDGCILTFAAPKRIRAKRRPELPPASGRISSHR